jgi:hypothetical protein
VRRLRELVIGKNRELSFDMPKATAGCSANGRRRKGSAATSHIQAISHLQCRKNSRHRLLNIAYFIQFLKKLGLCHHLLCLIPQERRAGL